MSYIIFKHILRAVMKPFIGKISGLENLPLKGGAILAANHSSYLDHLVIAYALSKRRYADVHTLAKKEHFDNFLERKWHRYLNAIPIDRQAGGKEALREAISYLKKGHLIWIYPEGTRTLTGKMNRAKSGVARLALSAKVPVIPIGITNTFSILPKGARIPKMGKRADLKIGKPLYFEKYYQYHDNHKKLREVTTTVMKTIATLCKKKYTFD